MSGTVPPELIPPTAGQAALVASWSTSAEEAAQWCSVAEHPFDPANVRDWWEEPDVQPWLLLDGDRPVAYGEIWTDEEGEAELARVLVDPEVRGRGVARRLVTLLVGLARSAGIPECFVRVVPENLPALAAYRAAGFVDVDEALAAEWNVLQPTEYVWLRHAGG